MARKRFRREVIVANFQCFMSSVNRAEGRLNTRKWIMIVLSREHAITVFGFLLGK
jgi:hypothetical protein